MILYLVRHGIAVDPNDPKSPPEPERPLTAKGVQKTRAAALGLSVLGIKPDVMITSPYVRATQTAEIFAETLGFSPAKIRVHDALKPAGNPAEIAKEVISLARKGSNVLRPCPAARPHDFLSSRRARRGH